MSNSKGTEKVVPFSNKNDANPSLNELLAQVTQAIGILSTNAAQNNGETTQENFVETDKYKLGMAMGQEAMSFAKKSFENDFKEGKLGGYIDNQWFHTYPIRIGPDKQVLFPFILKYSYNGYFITYEWKDPKSTVYVHGIHAQSVLDYLDRYNTSRNFDRVDYSTVSAKDF